MLKKLFKLVERILIILSVALFIIGYLTGRFNTILCGLCCIFISNVIYALLDWKQHLIFLFFHFTFFTFLLSRPVISMFRGNEWWYFSVSAVLFALNAIFVSLIALRIGSKLMKKKHCEIVKNNEQNDLFIESFQAVALILFYITMAMFLVAEFEKVAFMSGRGYEEYYISFQSSLPSFVLTIGDMMKYALCMFLTTMPSKKKAIVPLGIYFISAIPSLIIGIRNPIVLNAIFIVIYYLIRDILEDEKKWFGKTERIAIVAVLPIALIFLSAYNYIRDGVTVEMTAFESIIDLFYKQGVSFDVLCIGYEAIPDLPDVIDKNYTFGGIIDYITRGNIAQTFFGAAPLGNQNSEIVATYSNSFAHSMSYVAHPQYLSGHGWGSSYLLETFADWGYVGITLFSVALGVLMTILPLLLRRGILFGTISLMILTRIFFVPRAEATGWITFLVTLQFWVAFVFCVLCAFILMNSKLLKRKEDDSMVRKFGLEEILYCAKRYIALILVVIIAFGTVGFVSAQIGNDGSSSEAFIKNEFSSSKSYSITSKKDAVSYNKEKTDVSVFNIAESLKSDFAKQYIFENLLNKYSKQEIILYTGVEVEEEDLNYTVLNEVVKANVLTNSTIANFFAVTANAEFSKSIAELMDEYFKNVLLERFSNIEAYTYLGGTDVQILDDVDNGLIPQKTPAKRAIVFAIIGVVLSALFVLIKTFLTPTIASKSDYEEYGVPVIFDKAEYKSQYVKFAVDKLILNIQDAEYKKIAVLSDINSSNFAKAKDKYSRAIAGNEFIKNNEITFLDAKGILKDFQSFDDIKSCDAVILFERKGETYHKDYKNKILQLNNYGIKMVGTLLV